MRIAIDVDGTIANQAEAMARWMNEKYYREDTHKMTEDDVVKWNGWYSYWNNDTLTHEKIGFIEEIHKAQKDRDFVMGHMTLPYAVREINMLREEHTIIIATNRAVHATLPTKRWLKKNGIGWDEYISTTDTGKGVVQANILIDDFVPNLIQFYHAARNRPAHTGYGILACQKWSKDIDVPGMIKAVKNFDHLRKNRWMFEMKFWTEIMKVMDTIKEAMGDRSDFNRWSC
ncbi:MAG: 5' nucleotidase, NT5C type [Candidatus Thorarchaeota archaeon]|jgi:uncharacterized HAD superfamily protein